MVQSAAESVYKLVGVRRGVAEVGDKWGNFGLYWCGWQIVGSAPDGRSFSRVSRRARRVYYGAVFEIKTEIPADVGT
jgi:hypothetical protein